MASLMNVRVDDDLKEHFITAAEAKRQSQSEAMRDALLLYIKRARNEQLRDASARIRASGEDEEDALRWSEEHGIGFGD